MGCKDKSGRSMSMLFGSAAVPTLVSASLHKDDTMIPTAIAQHWSDKK